MSALSSWWSNPVAVLPDSTAATVTLTVPSIVYVATASMVSHGYNINAPKIAIFIPSGITLTGLGTNNFNYPSMATAAPNSSSVITIQRQPFTSLEGGAIWSLGDLSTTDWSINGNSVTQNLIIYYASHYTRLKNLNLTRSASNTLQPNNSYGVRTARMNISVSAVSAIREYSLSHSDMRSMNIYNTTNTGMVSFSASYGNYQDMYFSGSPNGLAYASPSHCTGSHIIGKSIASLAISMQSAQDSTFSDFEVTQSGYGLYHYGTTARDTFTRMLFTNNGGNGFATGNTMANTVIDGLIVNGNGFGGLGDPEGVGAYDTSTGGVIYKNVIAANNSGAGMLISSAGAVLSHVLAVNNGAEGIKFSGAAKSVVQTTVMNNLSHGINQDVADAGTTYHQIAAINNGADGLHFRNETLGATISESAIGHNGQYGIFFGDVGTVSKVKLTGQLLITANGSGACRLSATGVTGIANAACANGGASTAVLQSPASILASFNGPVPATAATRMAIASITDWTVGESTNLTWGKDAGGRGPCLSGETCQLADWSLKASDSVLRNTSGDGLNPNEGLIAGSTCPSATYGTVNDLNYGGSTQFLRNAVEDLTVGANKNGLCEASESCLYAPNFGYYQGEGSLIACTYQDNGGLGSISLRGYSTNGH